VRACAVVDGQVFDHEVGHHAHRGVVVPAGVVEQALHLVRGTVPGGLGQGPPVLAGQVAHQPLDVLARLQAGFTTGEDRPDAARQFLASFGCQLGGLYHPGSGRLVLFLIHSLEGSRDGRPQTGTSHPTRRARYRLVRATPSAGPPTGPATPGNRSSLRSRSAAAVKGPRKGELDWQPLRHHTVLRILHNPRYAGAFTYGRRRDHRRPDGKYVTVALPRDQWFSFIPDAHPGYITLAQYEANQARLTANAAAHGRDRTTGPALLQGIIVCGRCGHRMPVRYHTRAGRPTPTYLCQREGIATATPICTPCPATPSTKRPATCSWPS
jgi:hypothetical protein